MQSNNLPRTNPQLTNAPATQHTAHAASQYRSSGESTFNYIFSKKFLKTDTFQIVAGVSLGLIVAYSGYLWLKKTGKTVQQQETTDPSAAGLSTAERAKRFIKQEMQRLSDPKFIENFSVFEGHGILERKDFFDLLLLIQLKTKLKLQKEVQRNQRERIKLLEAAMNPGPSQFNQYGEDAIRMAYERYMERTMEIMLNEFEEYEDQFGKILMTIGISNDTWDASREQHIQGPETTLGAEESMIQPSDGLSIENIDKRVYEFLPQPNIPKSLTKEKTKSMMIDVNHRASKIFKQLLRGAFSDNENYSPDCEPLFMETLAYDLALVEYGVNETVFRFAIHKFNLQKDPEIKEYLEDYLSS